MKKFLRCFQSYRDIQDSLQQLNRVPPGKYDVIFHIGPPKTGTSAIQRFCLNNHDYLLRHGFYYPFHPNDKNGVSSGHGHLYVRINRRKANIHKIFRRCLKNARSLNCTLLLSAEFFWAIPDQILAEIADLRYAIVGLIRHPLDIKISGYNQAVKRAFYTEDFGHFASDLQLGHAQFGDRLEKWADGTDKTVFIVNPYQKKVLRQVGLVRMFLEVLNIPVPPSARRQRTQITNGSYLPTLLELKRKLNRVLDRKETRKNVAIDLILQKASDKYLTVHSGSAIERGIEVDTEILEKVRKACEPVERKMALLLGHPVKSDFSSSPTDSSYSYPLGKVVRDFKKRNVYGYICLQIEQALKNPELSDEHRRDIENLEALMSHPTRKRV